MEAILPHYAVEALPVQSDASTVKLRSALESRWWSTTDFTNASLTATNAADDASSHEILCCFLQPTNSDESGANFAAR